MQLRLLIRNARLRGILVIFGFAGLLLAVFLPSEPPLPIGYVVLVIILTCAGLMGVALAILGMRARR